MFKQLLLDQVSNLMVVLDDLSPTITYTSQSSTPTYDPITGVVTENITTEDVSAVLASFSLSEMDNSDIVATDLKALIAAKDLVAVPAENDRVTAKGREWNVQRVMGVPGESLHTLQLRQI